MKPLSGGPAESRRGDMTGRPSTILIVDDDPAGLYTKQRILHRHGYHLLKAMTGAEALRMTMESHPDLILLDVKLPDISGLELCQRLKSDPATQDIKIIQTSAICVTGGDKAKGLDFGGDGYLVEPTEPEELVGTVRALLRLAEKEQENRRLIEHLSRTERRFVEATEAGDIGLWDWDIARGRLEWFGAHERLAGLASGGFSGSIETFTQILHPDDRTRVWTKLRRLMDHREERFVDDYRFVHPDGSIHWMNGCGSIHYDMSGRATRMTGVVQDITERKQAEDAICTAHDSFRCLVEQSPFGVYTVDANFRLAQVSAGAQKVFANVKPLLGRDFADVLHQLWPEPFASDVIARFRHTLETGEPYHSPSTVEQRRDIDVVEAYDWKIERVKLTDGQFGVVCHFYDLSERQRYGAKLKESEERLRLALEGGELGSWDMDLTSGQVVWNQRHAELMGYEPDYAGSYESWRQLVHPHDVERVVAAIEQAKHSHRQFAEEHRFRRADTGEWRWMSLYGRFVYDEAGQPVRFSGVSLDITDRKQIEETVEQRTRQLDLLARTSQSLLLGDPSQPEVLETIFADIARLIDMEMFYHYRPGTDPRMLRLHLSGGTSQRERDMFATMGFGELLCGRVAQQRQQILVEDLQHSSHPGSGVLRDMGMTSYAGFPLVANDELVGTLAFVSKHRTHLRPGDVQTIQTICDQLAAALERARLHRALCEGTARNELLANSAALLLRSDSPLDAVNSLCRNVMAFLDCQVFFNYLLDQSCERLYLNASSGIGEEEARRIEWLEIGSAVCGCVARDGKRIVAECISEVEDVRTELVRSFGIQAYACHPLIAQEDLIGTLSFGTRTRTAFSEEDLSLMKAVADQVAIALQRKQSEEALRASEEQLRTFAGELERLVDERTQSLRQSQEHLRALTSELILAEQRERKRIAMELHDHLQQMLVVGKMAIGQGKRAAGSLTACDPVLQKVDEILSDALTYSRTLVAELSPPALRNQGFVAGVQWLAEYMQSKHKHSVTVIVPGAHELMLTEDQSILLFQSVRELLINSAKHAECGRATVRIECFEETLSIEVRDQGKGFNIAAAAAAAETTSGGISSKFGLFSIQERMTALGGSFQIHSTPGQGTTARLLFPLAKSPGVSTGGGHESSKTTQVRRSRQDRDPFKPDQSVTQVLLVDDHAMVRQGLRSVLDAYPDIQVVGEASDGLEAVELVKALLPHVVVMDINMPKMGGIEATSAITSQYPHMLVVGLSVNSTESDRQIMQEAGAVALLSKESAVTLLYETILAARDAHQLPSI